MMLLIFSSNSKLRLHAQNYIITMIWFGLVVWTPSRGRKVGIPRGILPHVQGCNYAHKNISIPNLFYNYANFCENLERNCKVKKRMIRGQIFIQVVPCLWARKFKFRNALPACCGHDRWKHGTRWQLLGPTNAHLKNKRKNKTKHSSFSKAAQKWFNFQASASYPKNL